MKYKVGDITTIRTGKLDANASSEDGKYPFFTCSREPLKIDTYSYDCECVLIAGNGDLNVKYYNGKFDAYQRTYIIQDNSNGKLFMPYLYCFMDKYIEVLRKQSIGGVIKYIKLNNLTDALIELPSLEKQKELVGLFNKNRQLIENQNKKLNLLDELVKARFVEMFDSINNNKYGYDVKTIQEVCESIKDGTHQTPTYTEDSINGFKFLSSKDVATGKVDWNHLKYIPADLHEQLYARLAPKKGDILLAKNGTTGIAAIVDRDEIFDIYVSLALLRPLDTVTSDYLCNAINSFETKTQFNERLKGVGVPNLHLGEIKKTRIVVPPMDKQNEFTTFVREIDKSKFVIQKQIDETQMLFDSLMQRYFE